MIMPMVVVPQHHPAPALRVGQMNEPRLIQQLPYTDPGFTLEQQVVAGCRSTQRRPSVACILAPAVRQSFEILDYAN